MINFFFSLKTNTKTKQMNSRPTLLSKSAQLEPTQEILLSYNPTFPGGKITMLQTFIYKPLSFRLFVMARTDGVRDGWATK
jgi:hypothetical protein